MNVFLVAFEILFIFNSIPTGMLQLMPSNRTCVMQGSFEIKDGTCTKYYICVYNGVAFNSYDLSCSLPMVFNPLLKYCTSLEDYTCTQVTSSTSSSTLSSTLSSALSSTTNSTLSSTTSSTPSSTTSSTLSSTTSSTPSSTTSSTPSSTPSTTPSPVCPTSGKFPVAGDLTCQRYTFCYVNSITTIQYNLTCPNGLKFNRVTQKCVLPCPGVHSCPPCVLTK